MSYSRQERFTRSMMMLGEQALEKLEKAHIAIIGLGGVGSYAAEAVARAGAGEITLLDGDCVSVSNINRQLCALETTVGQRKTQVTAERLSLINPEARLHTLDIIYSAETSDMLFSLSPDFIIDCIDTVSAKTELICQAAQHKVPIISALGTGNKTDPTQLEFADIYSTSVCPLARAMRRELKKRGVAAHRVLYSREQPYKEVVSENGRHAPGSVSWVPGCAGLLLAGDAVKFIVSRPD